MLTYGFMRMLLLLLLTTYSPSAQTSSWVYVIRFMRVEFVLSHPPPPYICISDDLREDLITDLQPTRSIFLSVQQCEHDVITGTESARSNGLLHAPQIIVLDAPFLVACQVHFETDAGGCDDEVPLAISG